MGRAFPERFRVAFSLAGEQSDIVRPIAKAVENALGPSTVFYYEWFEYWVASAEADTRLQDLYQNRCDLLVVCMSEEYNQKPWTRLEHRAVRARRDMVAGTDLERQAILTVDAGEQRVGVLENEIAPSLRARSVEKSAELILDRLAWLDGRRAAPAISPEPTKSWLPRGVDLDFRVADHKHVRSAFQDMLRPDADAHVLLVRGGSGTGKTELSNQMFSATVSRLPDVRCGRLDLKGGSDLTDQVNSLTFQLGLDRIEEPNTAAQLERMVERLCHRPRPSLIVVDTYEQAGYLAGWVEDWLLLTVCRETWLRVVVLGQDVPDPDGRPWAGVAAPTLALDVPSAEDWIEYYGEDHVAQRFADAGIDRDPVELLHDIVRMGSPEVIKAMVGARP